MTETARRDPHQAALLESAARAGIRALDLLPAWGIDAVRYERGGRSALVLKGRIFPGLPAVSERVCDDKHATKAVLAGLGIPAPPGVSFADPDDEADAAAIRGHLARSGSHVLKPVNGTEGRAVRLGIRTFEAVRSYAARWRGSYERFVLEEQADGEDLRIQAVGGEAVAACTRRPACITGDGRTSLAGLIEARREAMAEQNPQNRLEIDADTRRWLERQALAPEDVPAAGREVRLKTISNMSVGGVAVDVTDTLHADYRGWISAIAGELDLDIFALDVIAADPAADPDRGARVLEVNARPQWLHHTFSERRTHDIGRVILARLLQG